MRWIAGYHTSNGEHRDDMQPTWVEARAALVDELDMRLLGYLDDSDGHETQIEELEETLRELGTLDDEEEYAADADGVTFVLVPGCTRQLREAIAADVTDVIGGEPA